MAKRGTFQVAPTGPVIALGAAGALRVLLIAPNPDAAREITALLTGAAVVVQVRCLAGLDGVGTVASEWHPDAIVLDLAVASGGDPEPEPVAALARVREAAPTAPVVILAAARAAAPEQRDDLALRLIKGGAQDVLDRGTLHAGLLTRAVAYAIERQASQAAAERHLHELESSEARFRSMVESSLDGLLVIDRHCIVRFANPAARRMLETDTPLVDNVLQLPVHQHATEPLQIMSPDGGRSLAEMKVVGIDWYGERAWMAAIRDLSERVRIEQLEQRVHDSSALVAKMQELDRVRAEFIESVTHELRTPMTPLRSAAEMLLDGTLGELGEQQRAVVEMMARNIERLSRFATGVLNLSQIDTGSYPIAPVPIDVRGTIEHVVLLWAARALDRGSSLALHAEPGIRVLADPDALCQVVGNLLENALAHNEPGLRIEVLVQRAGNDRVLVEVRDDGKGIDPKVQARVFEKFFQAARVSGPGYRGAGLGLALCKGFVEAMGGVFQLDSEPGRGASFSFLLPAVPPEAAGRADGDAPESP